MTESLLFRQATKPTKLEVNKYKKFNFTRNPFPAKPSVTVGSNNPIENGSIYLPELREKEQQKFETLLIPTPERFQTRSITFLMDYATRRGRGIGKTAFLHHQHQRIMKDLGDELSGGTEVIFAIYLLPLPDGKTRKIWQLCKLITQALIEGNIIAIAMWRLRASSGIIPEEVLANVGDTPQETIGNDKWLSNKDVDVFWELIPFIKKKLKGLEIDHNLIEPLADHGHSISKLKRRYFESLSDHAWRNDNGQLVFNDLIKVLMAAGLSRGLILVDEVEKIITPQNAQERRAFTDSLRYFFIDGLCENAKYSFYNLLLTVHPYVQELLNPHWSATGLDRFAALSGELASEYTIYFEPLGQESALPLTQVYLDASRLSEASKGTIEPFTSEALEEALMLSGRVPGMFLTLLNQAIEKAIQFDWPSIDTEKIRQVAQPGAPQEPDTHDTTEVVPPPRVNLKE